MKKRTETLTRLSLMLALSMIFSYIEHLLNLNTGIPGVKLGTANIVCLFALYRFPWYEAFGVNMGRIALSALLFGTPVSFLYSAVGGMLAFVAMFALKKTKLFGTVGVSVSGSVTHSFGQLLAASFITGSTAVFSYLPFMLLWTTVFGTVTGGICHMALKRVKR